MARGPCLAQTVKCRVVYYDIDGEIVAEFRGVNSCEVDGFNVCPRRARGIPSGEGYEICQSRHAEQEAIEAMKDWDFDYESYRGEAFVKGHTYFCKECQEALARVNVTTFTLE